MPKAYQKTSRTRLKNLQVSIADDAMRRIRVAAAIRDVSFGRVIEALVYAHLPAAPEPEAAKAKAS